MKKLVSYAAMLLAAASFTFTSCANDDSGSSDGGNDAPSSEISEITSSSGKLAGTTWLFIDSESKSTYVAPPEPVEPSTGNDPTDTPKDPTDTPENPTDTPENPTDTPVTPEPAKPVSKTSKGTYMHITSDGICYVGEVTYTEKLSGDEYVIDMNSQDSWSYKPAHKGKAVDTNGKFDITLSSTNETDKYRWLKNGDYRYLYSSEGLYLADLPKYKATDNSLILQKKANDQEHTGEYIYTNYNWKAISFKAAMTGPSTEVYKIYIKNEINDFYFTKSEDIVPGTSKVVETILNYINQTQSAEYGYNGMFAIEGNTGTSYYVGKYGSETLNGAWKKANSITDDVTSTFADISDNQFTVKAVTSYEVRITIDTQNLARDPNESGIDITKPNTLYKLKWTGSGNLGSDGTVYTEVTDTQKYVDILKKLIPQNGTDVTVKIYKDNIAGSKLYEGSIKALESDTSAALQTKFSADTDFYVTKGTSTNGGGAIFIPDDGTFDPKDPSTWPKN